MNLELFFKSLPELRQVLTKYADFKPRRINLPNKSNLCGIFYRDAVNEILNRPSNLPPVVHYSVQYEFEQDLKTSKTQDYQKSHNKPKNKTYDKFVDFLQTFGPGIKSSGGQILLVSGYSDIYTYVSGGEKKKFDSTSCLEQLREDLENVNYLRNSTGFVNTPDLINIPDLKSMFNKDAQYIPNDLQINLEPEQVPEFGVVFNPYYFDKQQLNSEVEHLRRKLATGIVKSVWLQFGTDLEKLDQGVRIIKNIQDDIRTTEKALSRNDYDESKLYHAYDFIHHKSVQDKSIPEKSVQDKYVHDNTHKSIQNQFSTDVSIYGSIFIPTPVFLEKIRVHPWQGLYCSKEHFDTENKAIDFTKQLLREYERLNISPLIESAIMTENDESYFWKIFDKDEFTQKITAERELENMRVRLLKEQKRTVTNQIKNKTLYSEDKHKLKLYEQLYEDYQQERPWY